MAGSPENTPKRRAELTPQLIAALAEAAALGHSITTACGHLGVSESGFHKWRRRGIDIIESGKRKKLSARDALCVELVNAIKKADADFVHRGLLQLQTIALKTKNWVIWAWLLERRRPHEFGRRRPEDIGDVDESRGNVPTAGEVVESMVKATVGNITPPPGEAGAQ